MGMYYVEFCDSNTIVEASIWEMIDPTMWSRIDSDFIVVMGMLADVSCNLVGYWAVA